MGQKSNRMAQVVEIMRDLKYLTQVKRATEWHK